MVLCQHHIVTRLEMASSSEHVSMAPSYMNIGKIHGYDQGDIIYEY